MGIYVTGIGIVSALGRGWPETAASLRSNRTGIAPLTLFPHARSAAVGEIKQAFVDPVLPRTHQIARIAAEDALAACGGRVPEAVVIGMTTGGMPKSEGLLQSGAEAPDLYRFHGSGSVAQYIADLCKCDGPAFTLSTACSSGAGAVALGAKLLQSGLFQSVLAGGADALCRLTYHGFNALQLLSPEGAAPFDRDRNGMSLSEGGAMLLMESAELMPENAVAEIRGLGLSCDAYHAAAPIPRGAVRWRPWMPPSGTPAWFARILTISACTARVRSPMTRRKQRPLICFSGKTSRPCHPSRGLRGTAWRLQGQWSWLSASSPSRRT